jgi:hypothetical protein
MNFTLHFTKQLTDYWATLYFILHAKEQVNKSYNPPDFNSRCVPFCLRWDTSILTEFHIFPQAS